MTIKWGLYCLLQAVIAADIIAPLVNLLQNAEFDIRKEAAWAISNATSGGSPEQIKYEKSCFVVLVCLWISVWSADIISLCWSQVPGKSRVYQALV